MQSQRCMPKYVARTIWALCHIAKIEVQVLNDIAGFIPSLIRKYQAIQLRFPLI